MAGGSRMIFAQVQDAYGGLLGQDQGNLPQTGMDLWVFVLIGVAIALIGIRLWLAAQAS
jgi:LPXTG-motif cell wall-anchored protein